MIRSDKKMYHPSGSEHDRRSGPVKTKKCRYGYPDRDGEPISGSVENDAALASRREDEEGEEQLWYVCLGCNRAFQKDFQLRIHRRDLHGKQGSTNGGHGKKKFGATILTKDDLSPNIPILCCIRFPPKPPITSPTDTRTSVDGANKNVGGGPKHRSRNNSNEYLLGLKQLCVKLVKVQFKAKQPQCKTNRRPSSSKSSARKSKIKEPPADKSEEAPKNFSSIFVNTSLTIVKSEYSETNVGNETDTSVLVPEHDIDDPPVDHFEGSQHLQNNATNSRTSDDLNYEIDYGETMDSPECMEFGGQPSPESEANDVCQLPEGEVNSIETEVGDTQGSKINSDEPRIEGNQVNGLTFLSNSCKVRLAANLPNISDVSDQHLHSLEDTNCTESQGPDIDVHLLDRSCDPGSPVPAIPNYPDQRGSKLRPFKCGWPDCGKAYKEKHHLKRHKGRVHEMSARVPDGIAVTSNQLEVTEKELDDVPAVAVYLDNKLQSSPHKETETESTDDHQNSDEHRVRRTRTREAKLRARDSIYKSVHLESASEEECEAEADENDTEFYAVSSSSSEEDEREVERPTEKSITSLIQSSPKLFSTLADGIEEMYMECVICHCRYKNSATLEIHLKSVHSKAQVNQAVGIRDQANVPLVGSSAESWCTETANPEAVRTCKTCGEVYPDVPQLNKHIIHKHLNLYKKKKKKMRQKLEDQVDEKTITELIQSSPQLLLALASGKEVICFECVICYCRYVDTRNLRQHLKNNHSILQVNNSLKILKEEKTKAPNENSTKHCHCHTERMDPKSVRKCKACGGIFTNVRGMNRHILNTHLTINKITTKARTVREIADGKCKASINKSVESAAVGDEPQIKRSIDTAILELVQSSHQIVLTLADGKEERYLECLICYCRYTNTKCLERHIKQVHSELKINNAFDRFGVDSGQRNCCTTETTDPKISRTCRTCGDIFRNEDEMNDHIIQNHLHRKKTSAAVVKLVNVCNQIQLKSGEERTGIWECKICCCKYLQIFHLQRHIKDMHSEEEIDKALSNCEQAETKKDNNNRDTSTSTSTANKLTVVTDPDEIRRCTSCGTVEKSLEDLNKHIIQVHLVKAKLKCSICGKQYSTSSKQKLRRHMLMHHGVGDGSEKKFLCNICGKTFALKEYLKRHTLEVHIHKEVPPDPAFKCEVCQRPCTSKATLRHHMISHSEATYLCTICGKKFRQQAYYKMHLSRHGEERPYKCKQCPASFKISTRLNHHTRIEHKGRTYDCGQCGKKFDHPNKRTLHVKKDHHGQIYKCDVCEKVLGDSIALKLHKQRFHDPNYKPRFECDTCQKVFMFASLLANHKKAAHGDGGQVEKMFKCEECGKKFEFKCQLKTHSASHGSKCKKKKQESSHSEDDISREDS